MATTCCSFFVETDGGHLAGLLFIHALGKNEPMPQPSLAPGQEEQWHCGWAQQGGAVWVPALPLSLRGDGMALWVADAMEGGKAAEQNNTAEGCF